MKVSITSDREVKDKRKKQWVQEIQSVVDKLNNPNKSSEALLGSEEIKDQHGILSSYKKLSNSKIPRETDKIKRSTVSSQAQY